MALSPNEIARCLNDGRIDNEADSPLWQSLADWAWSHDPDDIPDAASMSEQLANSLLDEAEATIPELRGAQAWRSAARYFEAENFHGLVGPACERATTAS